MAEEDSTEESVEEGAPAKKKKLAGRTIVLFMVAPILLLLGLGAGAYFFFLSGPEEEAHGEQTAHGEGHGDEHGEGHGASAHGEAAHDPDNVIFYDLPELIVNIASPEGAASYLKLKVALELDHETDLAKLEFLVPRVMDRFQVYLRELRMEDLNGSAAMFRIKIELLRRVNTALAPVRAYDVLFKELIVQ